MKLQTKIFFTAIFILLTAMFVNSQTIKDNEKVFNSLLDRNLNDSQKYFNPNFTKSRGHYSTKDWQNLIDQYWGMGLPTNEKLEIFDQALEKINTTYAAFQNLDINLDSLRNYYRAEIEAGVSRGRFAAIMNHIALALMEAHTIVADTPVNFGTNPQPGVPLFVIGSWRDNSRFGASLTPLPDSSLLVYSSLLTQKLGLKAGDIILGYDGIPWKKLYKDLLKAELPIYLNGVWGSTKKSLTHCLLASAGLNWHLFDTIDVVKYSTKDTLHLSTSPMILQKGFIYGNEQLPVKGVPFPDFKINKFVYWGIVNETNIGYIYVTSWSPDAQYHISTQFYNAIDSLMNVHHTEGLILDFRYNSGGWMGVANAGYSLLFNRRIQSVAFDIRTGNSDHFDMKPHPTYTASMFTIPGDFTTYYDKPIAVLTGPGSISNGDFESWRMKLHDNTRLFGKSSCGAFATSILPSLNNSDWFFYLTYGNSYPVNSSKQYLVHTDLEIDEDVWLTQQGVANGIDDVAEKAINWIKNKTSIDEEEAVVDHFFLSQNYPNPFNPSTVIEYSIPLAIAKSGETWHSVDNSEIAAPSSIASNDQVNVTLKIYDVLGNEIAILVNERKSPGKYKVKFDASNLASGIYFYRINSGNFNEIKKMILLK